MNLSLPDSLLSLPNTISGALMSVGPQVVLASTEIRIGTRTLVLVLGGIQRNPERGCKLRTNLNRSTPNAGGTLLRPVFRSREIIRRSRLRGLPESHLPPTQLSKPRPHPKRRYASTLNQQTSHLCLALLPSPPRPLRQPRKSLLPTPPLVAYNSLWSTVAVIIPSWSKILW